MSNMEHTTSGNFSSTALPGQPATLNLDFIDAKKKAPEFASKEGGFRPKTSLRLKYEAEARVLKRQLGGLEEVRSSLGLSRRKMCQLLLVDPSAWTRWLKNEDKVPPHILRSLQWYLELENKRPEWAQWREYVLKRNSPQDESLKKEVQNQVASLTHQQATMIEDFRRESARLAEENQKLSAGIEKREALGLAWKALLLMNSLFVVYHLVRAMF